MKFFLLITCLHTAVLCSGQIDKTIYRPYKNTADSIVTLYVGQQTFDKYIKLDSAQSEFLALKIHWSNKSKFNENLSFRPNVFEFNYSFTHPALLGEAFDITFMLDSSRQLMPGFLATGLINLTGIENLKIISREQAITTSRREKIKKPIDEFRLELGWYEEDGDYEKYQRTKDLRDLVRGKMVWRIESKFRDEPAAYDEEPYSEIFVIDALTGQYLAKESRIINWD